MNKWIEKTELFLTEFYGKEIVSRERSNYFIFYERLPDDELWKFSFHVEDGSFVIRDIVVPYEYRNKGFIKKLLEFAITELHGITDIGSIYNVNGRLYRYLLSLGFEDTEQNTALFCKESEGYIPYKDGEYPDIILKLTEKIFQQYQRRINMDIKNTTFIIANYMNEDFFKSETRKTFFEKIVDNPQFKIDGKSNLSYLPFIKFFKDYCERNQWEVPLYLQKAIYNLFKYNFSEIFGKDGEGEYLIEQFARNGEIFNDYFGQIKEDVMKLPTDIRKHIICTKNHPMHYLTPEMIILDNDIGHDYEFLNYLCSNEYNTDFDITTIYMPTEALCSFGGFSIETSTVINKLINTKNLISNEYLKEKFLSLFEADRCHKCRSEI
jgi:hypothetical protein